MNERQKDFELILNSTVKDNFGFKLIEKKLKDLEIYLPAAQINELVQKLKNINDETLTFEIDDGVAVASSVIRNGNLKEIKLEINDEDVQSMLDKFQSVIGKIYRDSLEDASKIMLKTLKSKIKSEAASSRRIKKSIESHISRFWSKPLDTLETFLVLVIEAGSSICDEYMEADNIQPNLVLETLIRLQARGAQIGGEILALIRAGYPDGAHARWRTLHEIVVVGYFISKYGQNIAKRYLAHDVVESYKAANQYQAYCHANKREPLSDKELNEIKMAYDEALDQFGSDFKYDYGWASPAFPNNKNPKFIELEKDVDMDKYRPFYRLASHSVHANPKGVFFSLALPDNEVDSILLAGVSDTGFTNPAHGMAISLLQITSLLLTHDSNIDKLIFLKILDEFEKMVGQEFVKKECEYDVLNISKSVS